MTLATICLRGTCRLRQTVFLPFWLRKRNSLLLHCLCCKSPKYTLLFQFLPLISQSPFDSYFFHVISFNSTLSICGRYLHHPIKAVLLCENKWLSNKSRVGCNIRRVVDLAASCWCCAAQLSFNCCCQVFWGSNVPCGLFLKVFELLHDLYTVDIKIRNICK